MDVIQRKLELLDAELAWRRNFHQRLVGTCPLVLLAAGIIAGILLQSWVSLSMWLWLLLLVLFTSTAVVLIVSAGKNHRHYMAAYVVLCCFTCLGAIRLINYNFAAQNDIRNLIADQPTLATIAGVIITEPYINKQKQQPFTNFRFTDPATSFYLKVRKVKAVTGWVNAAGTVLMRVDEPVLDLKAGNYIQAYCWLARPGQPTNPGQFNTALYLQRKNIFVIATVKSRQSMDLLQTGQKKTFIRLKSWLRQKAAEALLPGPEPENQGQALLEALLLGRRANIDSRTYAAFEKTGLLHFISLSGMHLGIITGIIWWLCKLAGLMKRSRAVICIIAIAVFVLVVPPREPTLRAAIMVWVFCISFLFRRRFNSLNTLSLAAIILLLIRPTCLFDAGWQLSFASVLGLLLFCRRIHLFLYEKITSPPVGKKPPLTRPFYRITSWPGPDLLQLFSTSFTAWLGGAGILLYHFNTITPLTCVWTAIVFPLLVLILTMGFLKILLAFLLPTAAMVLGIAAETLCGSLIRVVELMAKVDISHILIGHVPVGFVVVYYLLILTAAFVCLRNILLKKVIVTVVAVGMVLFAGTLKWQRTYPDKLLLTALDVGHGQAVLAQPPCGKNILFDAGSLYQNNAGRKIVTAFMRYSGINRIHAIAVSHSHPDHINAIPEILASSRVDAVYANRAFIEETHNKPNGTAGTLRKILAESGREIKSLANQLTAGKDLEIKILWPTEPAFDEPALDLNDKSTVYLVKFHTINILLCSDVGKYPQGRLLVLLPDLKADVVVVPHHGSVRSREPGFLESLGADFLICSCDQTQYERIIPTYEKMPGSFFCTASDGAVTVTVADDGTIKTHGFIKTKK